VRSDNIDKQLVSGLNWIIGHPAGVHCRINCLIPNGEKYSHLLRSQNSSVLIVML
jgi:hypothetical protein